MKFRKTIALGLIGCLGVIAAVRADFEELLQVQSAQKEISDFLTSLPECEISLN